MNVLLGFESQLQHEPDEQRQRKLRQLIEHFLDTGHGSCILRRPEVAQVVIDSWQHFAGQR